MLQNLPYITVAFTFNSLLRYETSFTQDEILKISVLQGDKYFREIRTTKMLPSEGSSWQKSLRLFAG